jgi:hypothetical protein
MTTAKRALVSSSIFPLRLISRMQQEKIVLFFFKLEKKMYILQKLLVSVHPVQRACSSYWIPTQSTYSKTEINTVVKCKHPFVSDT